MELFKLHKAVIIGLEIEWEYKSISIYFLLWELYIPLKSKKTN